MILGRESLILRAQEVVTGDTTKSPNLSIIDCASGFSENVRQIPYPQVIDYFGGFLR